MTRFVLYLLLAAHIALSETAITAEPSKASHIEVGEFRVAWDSRNRCFQLEKSGERFANVFVENSVRDVVLADWKHSRLGAGRVAQARSSNGESVKVILTEDVPFILLQSEMAADPEEDRSIHHIKPFRIGLEMSAAPTAVKALGTAGLTAPDAHPGSYAFLAVASPETRAGIVSGWISHNRGCGVVFSDVQEGTVQIRPQIDYGRLRIARGNKEPSELFAVGPFQDARLGLEAYADTVATLYDIHLRPVPTGYCTWYSNPHGGASDETHLAELAKVAADKLKPYGFDFVQIDDKWQEGERRNGPAKVFGTHKPTGPYPSGMKAAADNITAQGLTAGIWFMPFAGDHDDPFFADHQDWFVRHADGTPYWARWGGTSLDMTYPPARDYVRSVVHRLAYDWGYRYFKMDGLWVGSATKLTYVNNGYVEDDIGDALFHDPDKTNIEAYRDGLKLVREAAGGDVFFLGCCIPQNMRSFGAAFGMVDAMRIGPDNGTSWEALCRGPWHGTNRYFLHGRVWYNDPDPVYVRPSVPIDHARLICSWVTLSGQLNVCSEWLPGLPDDRMDLLRRTMPNHGLHPRPVDLFSSDLARIWVLTDIRRNVRRDIVGLFNWKDNETQAIDVSTEFLGLPQANRYVGFDYWADRFVPPFAERLQCTLPPAACRVLALRPETDHPMVVSTSRHITQGVVDLLDEQWNEDDLVLAGTSRVVEDDPYELRIVIPVGESSYQASEVTLDNSEGNARLEQSGPELRVHIEPAETRDIRWKVSFRRGIVRIPPAEPVEELRAEVSYRQVSLSWKSPRKTRFRVERSDGFVTETNDTLFCDRQIAPATKYHYDVQSIGWDGTLSEASSITVSTMDKLKLPPLPPAPSISISQLEPLSASTGWGKIGINQTCQGEPLQLLGKVYESGIGVHAPSTLVYAVPKGAKRFVAVAGLDDEKNSDPRQSVVLKVLGDAGEMGEPLVTLSQSPLLSDETLRIWHFNIELSTRLREIRLVVTDGGDGIACDHVDWATAGFVVSE